MQASSSRNIFKQALAIELEYEEDIYDVLSKMRKSLKNQTRR